MRAIRYHGPRGPFRLENVPMPEPGPGGCGTPSSGPGCPS